MLVKKINFKILPIEENEEGIIVQKGIEDILNEYRSKGYCDKIYNGCTDSEIVENKLYVTEYQEQEFRGYIEECYYQERKTYKVFIKDFRDDCFHIGYVPFNRVPEIEEWINNNELHLKGNIFVLGGNAKYCNKLENEIKTEKKTYGFEVELRFYDDKETVKHKKKSNNLFFNKKYIVLGIALLILIIIALFLIFKKVKFEVANFSMTSETTNYTNITNYTTYEGSGLITTTEKKGTYLVVLKKILKSGGDEDSEQESYATVMIANGKGEFATYDSGDVDKITKPQYDFEILGYIKFKN